MATTLRRAETDATPKLIRKPTFTPLLRNSTEDLTAELTERANKYTELGVLIAGGQPGIHDQLRSAAKRFIPAWNDFEDSQIIISEYSGGITNKLFKCTLRKDDGSAEILLLRLYGANTEQIIDRESEIVVFQALHKRGFGPCFYGTFLNGCAYGYTQGRSLQVAEMRTFRRQIARLLGQWHTEVDVPQFPPEPLLYESMKNWIGVGKTEESFVGLRAGQLERWNALNMDIRAEVESTEKRLTALNSPVVFCHNDLLSGNIIYNDETDSTEFIDFEYACYNYRAFDIANHFCEYTGFEMDWSLYPTREERNDFFEEYLIASKRAELDRERRIGEEVIVTKEEVEALSNEVNAFVSASHLYWGIWALAQAKISDIEFDFFEYALRRLSLYAQQKQGSQ